MDKTSKFSAEPWHVAIHRPFVTGDFTIVKVENKDGVVFDGFGKRVNDAILASKSLEMLEALRKIADPWEIKSGLEKTQAKALDVDVIFEMAKIARSLVSKIENEISNYSKS